MTQGAESTVVEDKGKLILLLGPSGSGKGSILRALREKHPEFVFPLSCTTRDPRPNERDGDVYNFVNKEEFKRKIEAGDFLEWAIVHGENYYGTLKKSIMIPLGEGKTVIREVDVQGLESIRELVPRSQLRSVFLTVDGWETLKARVLRRSELPDEEIARRHESFLKEMKWAEQCDMVIENKEGELDATISEVEEAIENMV